MTSKRELLLEICERPGWQPPIDASSIDRSLGELEREGWVLPRLDGFEASPRALDEYPHFRSAPDIADPRSTDGDAPAEHVEHLCVPLDRVATMLAALLHQMPFPQVRALSSMAPSQISSDQATWDLARAIAERMRR